MPAFKLDGRLLVSFAGWKAHCSIYPLTDTFLQAHAAELKGYERTKGACISLPRHRCRWPWSRPWCARASPISRRAEPRSGGVLAPGRWNRPVAGRVPWP